MNWNNIPEIKFRIYDPELQQFIVRHDFATAIYGNNVNSKKERYHICYNEQGLKVGFHLQNGDWEECTVFPYSGFEDMGGNELYLYDRCKYQDQNCLIDYSLGQWVLRYAIDHVIPLVACHTDVLYIGYPDRRLDGLDKTTPPVLT